MAIKHLEPGESVTVELVANANGNVATRGDLVQIAGESSTHTQAALVDTAGQAVALLDRQPEEYDPDAAYAAGDVVGEAQVKLRHAVDWMVPTGGVTFAPGDFAVSDVGGTVRALDQDGTAPDDADHDIIGRVWATNSRGTEYTAGKVAVIRHR